MAPCGPGTVLGIEDTGNKTDTVAAIVHSQSRGWEDGHSTGDYNTVG